MAFTEIAGSIPQNLQVLGLLVPALACSIIQIKQRFPAMSLFTASKFFERTSSKDANNNTVPGVSLPRFQEMTFYGHDHTIDGVTPKKDQMAVEILREGKTGEKFATLLVNKKDAEVIQHLDEGQPIPDSGLKHSHAGKNRTGPWEHA